MTEPVFERKPETMIPLHLHPQELEAVKRAPKLGELQSSVIAGVGARKAARQCVGTANPTRHRIASRLRV